MASNPNTPDWLDRVRRAWGEELGEPDSKFSDFLQSCAVDEPSVLHVEDLYLAHRCAQGQTEALEILEERYLPAATRAVARVASSGDAVQDVGQLLRIKLLTGSSPAIGSYAGRGKLEAWLKVTATREAVSWRRAHLEHTSALPEALDKKADPQLAHMKRLYQGHFEQAFRAALEGLSSKHQAVLRLRYVDRLSVDELSRVLRVHRVSAARRLAAAREELLSRTRRGLTAQIQLSGEELNSVLRLINSDLELSLGLLRVAQK
jgi:RNA polymerase sigma-70 factor (ECF subfamily)